MPTIDLAALPARLHLGRGHLGVPDRGSRGRRTAARRPSGTPSRHTPGTIDNGDTGDVACDHYHRWPEDVGADAAARRRTPTGSRWPGRGSCPDGDGPVNPAGLAFYDRLVDAPAGGGHHARSSRSTTGTCRRCCRTAAAGRSGDTAEHFAEYASVVAGALGDRVTDWATLNEPLCSAWIGHLEGRMAPGLTDLTAGRARLLPPAARPRPGHPGDPRRGRRPPAVGIVNNLSPVEPGHRPARGPRPRRRRADGHTNRWWLDPVARPRLSRRTWSRSTASTCRSAPGDLETIAAPLDWLGLNYYFRQVVADDPDRPGAVRPPGRRCPACPRTAMDWEVDAGRPGARCCCG